MGTQANPEGLRREKLLFCLRGTVFWFSRGTARSRGADTHLKAYLCAGLTFLLLFGSKAKISTQLQQGVGEARRYGSCYSDEADPERKPLPFVNFLNDIFGECR